MHSYPKVYALGHAAIRDLFLDPVLVEEKIDGSQFSFGVFDGELRARSKRKELILGDPEKLFGLACEVLKTLEPLLTPGWTYRAEYLQKPKHNTLAYARVPEKHLMIFDINTGLETYLSQEEKQKEAERVGLECVPTILYDVVPGPQAVFEMLREESCLGGTQPEGLVAKNYARFTADGRALMGKYVTEGFKEKHTKLAKEFRTAGKDVIDTLIAKHKTEARWRKAVEHLRDDGRLEGSPRDIGAILKELEHDFVIECVDEVLLELWDWAKPKLCRGIKAGFPEWYKERLLEEQFSKAGGES